MATTITLNYALVVSGSVPAATLSTAMAAVPVDTEYLEHWGLRVSSDTIGTIGSTITRTITLKMSASVAATFSLATVSQLPGPLESIAITAAGEDYIRPPLLTAVGGGNGAELQCWLKQVDTAIGGGGGSGYTAATKIVASGGQMAFGGSLPVLTPTIALGVITGVTVVDGGSLLNSPPKLVAVDSGGGSGAILTARMGVGVAKILSPGTAYSAPTVTVTDFFTAMTTNGGLVTSNATLESTVSSFMLASLQAATNSPVNVTATIS